MVPTWLTLIGWLDPGSKREWKEVDRYCNEQNQETTGKSEGGEGKRTRGRKIKENKGGNEKGGLDRIEI